MLANLLFWLIVAGVVMYFRVTTRRQRGDIFWKCTTALLVAAAVGFVWSAATGP